MDNTVENREKEFAKKGPVKFRYQKSKDYQQLVDRGIVNDLESSEFCWLASVEMAISPYISNDKERLNWIVRIATAAKETHLLGEGGRLTSTDDHSVVAFLNKNFSDRGIPLEVSQVDLREVDLFQQALEGNMLLVGVRNPDGGGHMMLVDKAYLDQDSSEAVIGILNPDAPAIDRPFAREYFGSNQPHLFIQGQNKKFGPTAFVLKSPGK